MNAYTPFQLVSAGQSHPGQRRQLNEDAWRIAGQNDAPHLWPERGRLFAVADGMGGHAAGEIASQLAIDTLFREYYREDGLPLSPALRLERAITIANRTVYGQSISDSAQSGMGTTLVTAIVRDDWLTVASVGDSRVYLIRDGQPRQITRDHSWVAEQVEAGMLSEEEAHAHIYRSVVTRSIGHRENVQVDIFELLLDPGDTILLCTDGLSGQISDADIALTINRLPPEQAVERLIELANIAGGPDNITAVILHVAEKSGAQATPSPKTQLNTPATTAPTPAVAAGPTPAFRFPSTVWFLLGLVVLLGLFLLIGGTIWAFRSGWLHSLWATATPTLPPIQTATPSPTVTHTPTFTATPTATPLPTSTPTATPTFIPTPTATSTPTPTATLTPTATPTLPPIIGPQIPQ